ncbi:MAG: serine/threonine protein kinase, partial [Blautia sp.]|nr:serine/threonine protein kinase [Blautia sp.]
MSHIPTGTGVCPYCLGNPRGQQIPHGLRPGTLLRGQYLVGNVIGEGGFGITYIGRDIVLDMKIAVKEFFPFGYATRNTLSSNTVTWSRHTHGALTEGDIDKLLTEAQSIAKFHDDPNVVDVRNYFKENNTAYIIMEYLDGMNVSARIAKGGPIPAREAFRLFLPLMNSLQGMHRRGIIHRDISPNNVRLLGNGRLKLMDFGSARYYQGGAKYLSVQYKEGFTPIEQRTSGGQQGPYTDVYSL